MCASTKMPSARSSRMPTPAPASIRMRSIPAPSSSPDWLADTLLALITQPRKDFYLTEPLGNLHGIAGVMFSGGVAEYVYQREARDFGDLGLRLGHAIRQKVEAGRLPWHMLPAGECIR